VNAKSTRKYLLPKENKEEQLLRRELISQPFPALLSGATTDSPLPSIVLNEQRASLLYLQTLSYRQSNNRMKAGKQRSRPTPHT
jgi:hypothetical protein